MTLDRFDPGRDQPGSLGRVPCTVLPGDVVVPCLFVTLGDASEAVVQSESELHHCFKVSYCSDTSVPQYSLLHSSPQLPWRLHIIDCLTFCVSVLAAVAEQQTESGPVSASEGQGSYHLFSAV